MSVSERSAKSLQSWSQNAEREAVLREFMQDPDAEPKVVSTHVDVKSAYTVRRRLADRYPNLVFKVQRNSEGLGQICAAHPQPEAADQAEVAESPAQGIDTE